MTLVTQNLGTVRAIQSGLTAPTNTQVIWYNLNDNLQYYFDVDSTTWVKLASTKATATEVTTGTNDDKYVTPLAIKNSNVLDQTGSKTSGVASGTDTYSVTLTPAISAYVEGQAFNIQFINANTGPSTLNINGLGTLALVKNGGEALDPNDISANQTLTIYNDGINLQIIGGASSQLIGKALFVDATNGVDATGTPGKLNSKYKSISAAETDAVSGDTIFMFGGTYTDTNLGKNGVRYHFFDGAIMNSAGICFAPSGITFYIDGAGEFISTGGRTFQFSGATNAVINCKRIQRTDAASTAVHCIGTGTLYINVEQDITTIFQAIYVGNTNVLYLNAKKIVASKYGLMSIAGKTFANVDLIEVIDATAIDHACIYNDGGEQKINAKLLYYDCSTGTQGAVFMNNAATGNVSLYGDIQVVNTEKFFDLSGSNDKLFHRGKLYGAGTFDLSTADVDIEYLNTIKPATASGTDTYTATIVPTIYSYITNQIFAIKFTNGNTGAATLNLNSLGAIAIKKSGGSALASGDISSTQIVFLIYDGTNFQLIGGSGGGGGGTVTSVSGTANRITSTGGATPVIDISASYVGQNSITTLGTIGTGTWQGTVLGSTYGGTGVNNGSNTITLGGNLVTSGANNITLTSAGATNVTLPTTGTLATLAGTETLSSKRITPKHNTIASSATPTINTDTTDIFTITALAAAITSFTTNLSGTPTEGQKLIIRILDNGTARAITWGASFASRGTTLPTTTVISKYLYVGLIWNSVTSTWDCIASVQEV